MTQPCRTLSSNDSAVLGALFDPEASLQNHARIDLHVRGPYDAATLSRIKEKEKQALLPVNVPHPNMSDIQCTISSLDSVVAQYPRYASAWNNRAQAKRMLYDIGHLNHQGGYLGEVLADLAQAIKLASPEDAVEMTSPGNAKVLASAHTHRGYILWNASRSTDSASVLNDVEGLGSLSKERLEDLASREFTLGGRYGNQTAQQLAVKTNPYAKLCGSIVREAMEKEVREFYKAIQ